MTTRHLLLALVLCCLSVPMYAAQPAVRDGDIIFHTSRSSQSLAVQAATRSKYSHMGLVWFRDGKPFVIEAVATVRATPLDRWIARGQGGKFVVKRLRDAERTLTPQALTKLQSAFTPLLGKPYDLTFEWSDERIYCSELVWKAYDRALGVRIGALDQVRDFNLSHPAVRAKMRERYGDRVPLDEPVISPGVMFDSPLLVTIAAN